MIRWIFYFDQENVISETNEPSIDEHIRKSLKHMRDLDDAFLIIPGQKEIFINFHKIKCAMREEIIEQADENVG